MPSKVIDRTEPVVVPVTPPLRASRLPSRLRVPVLIVLSFGLRSALHSVASNFLGHELGDVSRIKTEFHEILVPFAYKVVVSWLGWQANYDWLDISSLTLLTNAPYAYLVNTFYGVSSTTVAAHVAIEIVANALPTYLLRPTSAIHDPHAPIPNRYLLNSFQVQAATTALAVAVYVVTLWTTIKSSWLTVFLVTHFDIPTLEVAYGQDPLTLISKIVAVGWAAQAFLLNPSLGAQSGSGAHTPAVVFDPAHATLPDTVKHNVWNYSKRTRTLIKQTSVLTAFMIANTVMRVLTVQGTDVTGSLGYALSAWALPTVVTAVWWTWVGDTSV